MNIESVFELIGLFGAVSAFYYYGKGGRRVFMNNARKALAILLVISIMKYFINALEWSGLLKTISLDYLEDYLDDIWPFAWFLFFFTGLMDASAQRLRESENRYRMIFNSSNDAILLLDTNGRIIDFNEAASTLTGYNTDELKGMTLSDLYASFDRSFFKKSLSGQKNFPNKNEARLLRKDGQKVETEFSSRPVTLGVRQTIHFGIRDITDRKQAEKSFLESQKIKARWKKMESLGLLAGGVAHDLNNILSGIIGYPELILMDLPENSKLRKPVEAMLESGKKSAAIVQDLLTVARGVAIAKEPLSLNHMVNEYLDSSEHEQLKQFHPSVTVVVNQDANLLNIKGSHVHVRKVLMNLVSNAGEAIEGSGTITLSTANRYLDWPLRGYDTVKPGEYAVLSVSDDGSGISADDLDRIFEPFYTKKVMGRSGTGLGLTVVWNVMQDHEGYIDVRSDRNTTTFELYFPITREKTTTNELPVSIEDCQGNGETILVVDDLKSQQEIVCTILSKLGYEATSVSSGEEAVEYLKEKPVNLIILDMIMDPGINGRQTYEQIIANNPEQKAIVTSGYAETADVKEVLRLGAGQYLKKPLTINTLALAVKTELVK